MVQISSTLPCPTREKLLREPADMVGISREVIEHKLNIHPKRTVVEQKRRGQEGAINKAINMEVNKLVKAGILRKPFPPP